MAKERRQGALDLWVGAGTRSGDPWISTSRPFALERWTGKLGERDDLGARQPAERLGSGSVIKSAVREMEYETRVGRQHALEFLLQYSSARSLLHVFSPPVVNSMHSR